MPCIGYEFFGVLWVFFCEFHLFDPKPQVACATLQDLCYIDLWKALLLLGPAIANSCPSPHECMHSLNWQHYVLKMGSTHCVCM